MTIPEIRSIVMDGKPFSESFTPENNEVFGLQVRLMIGPHEAEGEESFDLILCTPKWLDQKMKGDDVLFARHYVLVKTFCHASIQSKLEKAVRSCSAENWQEATKKLSRIGHWEFEDYYHQLS